MELQYYHKTKINKVNQGTFFKLKPTDTAPVWVRDHYDKSSKTYACHKMMTVIMRSSLREQKTYTLTFTF